MFTTYITENRVELEDSYIFSCAELIAGMTVKQVGQTYDLHASSSAYTLSQSRPFPYKEKGLVSLFAFLKRFKDSISKAKNQGRHNDFC